MPNVSFVTAQTIKDSSFESIIFFGCAFFDPGFHRVWFELEVRDLGFRIDDFCSQS